MNWELLSPIDVVAVSTAVSRSLPSPLGSEHVGYWYPSIGIPELSGSFWENLILFGGFLACHIWLPQGNVASKICGWKTIGCFGDQKCGFNHGFNHGLTIKHWALSGLMPCFTMVKPTFLAWFNHGAALKHGLSINTWDCRTINERWRKWFTKDTWYFTLLLIVGPLFLLRFLRFPDDCWSNPRSSWTPVVLTGQIEKHIFCMSEVLILSLLEY